MGPSSGLRTNTGSSGPRTPRRSLLGFPPALTPDLSSSPATTLIIASTVLNNIGSTRHGRGQVSGQVSGTIGPGVRCRSLKLKSGARQHLFLHALLHGATVAAPNGMLRRECRVLASVCVTVFSWAVGRKPRDACPIGCAPGFSNNGAKHAMREQWGRFRIVHRAAQTESAIR